MNTRLRDGSGHRLYRYLYEDVDRHGNVRIYFWRGKGHLRTRIKSTPGTPEFDSEYRLAYEGEIVKSPKGRGSKLGTVRWLCEEYYNSPAFKRLDPTTGKIRRRVLDMIAARLADKPYAMMRPQDVAKLRDEKADTPEAANQLVKAVRAVYAWACDPDYNHAKENPAAKTKLLSSRNPDGFRSWTEADVRLYCKFYSVGTKERLAIDLLLFTGCRRSDVIRLGPQMERDDHLIFTEFKGRTKQIKQHRLPILDALRVSIDATPATGQLAYLVNRYEQPFKPETFSKWFAERCRLAGIDAGLSAHGLRKFAAQWCAENGATEHQLMALFGWLHPDMARLYTQKANRARMEGEAARLLERKQR